MDSTPLASPVIGWLRRFGFRFGALYLALHNFTALLGLLPWVDLLDSSPGDAHGWVNDQWVHLLPWVGHHVLAITREIPTDVTGSGDMTMDWIEAWCFLVLAFAGALGWARFDRDRRHDARVAATLRVMLRYVLGAAMLSYGVAKLAPFGQFSPPSFNRLLEPFGEFSPMGVLWSFMGASKAYTWFSGFAEIAGGVLLLCRRTTPLGALVSAGVMFNVVLLNFCYDVPVKLFSTHLLVMAVWLLAPDLRRLACVLVLNRPTAAKPPTLDWPQRWQRLAVSGAKVLILTSIFTSTVGSHWLRVIQFGLSDPPSELTGIWEVDTFAREGVELLPLLTEKVRWRHLVVYGLGGGVIARRMDGTRLNWRARPIISPGKLILRSWSKGNAVSLLTFTRSAPDQLRLEGKLDGASLVVTLHRVDEQKFLLNSRGFHWISEVPFNR